ncbi:MAG TPA: hypothetical protein PLD62_04115 [Candidatus Cloacimonadota bacterium]|nr:hypothetical protein [Candidatus Cloacimonadota bacterium]
MENQMLLVLLALALFSTLMLNMYNLVLDDAKIVYNGIIYTQGQKIADRYFQQIEAELLGSNPIKTFSEAYTAFSNFSSSEAINNTTYNINISSTYCDSLGNISYPDSSYMRIDVRINCISPAGDTLYIGTQNSPFSKVLFDIGI